MSYFRLQANIISKKSQSAVASASYRSGEDLYSERDEELKTFKSREVAPVSFILKPAHAPEWALDRERLWNEVETVEKAWNAQLAREVLLALPVELTEDQQQELVHSFVQETFVKEGMVADVSIHRDKAHNPHAHVMLTVRPFNEDGTWGHKKVRQYEHDRNGDILRTENGEKIFQTVSSTNWNDRDTLVKWRFDYADFINQSFKDYGIDQTVSALSFEDQGLDRIAEVRLDRNEYQYVKRMEAKGIEAKTFYHQLNQDIRKKNAEIAQLNQKITFLSSKQNKTHVQAILHRQTEEIHQQLDPEYQKSLRFMQGRLKDKFSFQAVHQQLQGLYRWEERKLEPKQAEVHVTHAILNASHHAHQEGSLATLKAQGFPRKDFQQTFTQRLDGFEQLAESTDQEAKTTTNVIQHAERTYRIQSLIVHNAFNELYPDIEERYAFNDRTADFKAAILTDLQQPDGKHIPEPAKLNRQLQFHELTKACEQAEKASEQIRIQARLRNKLGAQKDQLLASGKEPDAVYQTSIKLNTAQQLITRYQEKAQLLDQQLTELTRYTFPHTKEKWLKKVEEAPLEVKTDILKHYTQKGNALRPPSLKSCLQKAQTEQGKRATTFERYQNRQPGSFYARLGDTHQQLLSHFPHGRFSSELFEQLIQQVGKEPVPPKEPEQPTKIHRKSKNKQIRRELGLEIEL